MSIRKETLQLFLLGIILISAMQSWNFIKENPGFEDWKNHQKIYNNFWEGKETKYPDKIYLLFPFNLKAMEFIHAFIIIPAILLSFKGVWENKEKAMLLYYISLIPTTLFTHGFAKQTIAIEFILIAEYCYLERAHLGAALAAIPIIYTLPIYRVKGAMHFYPSQINYNIPWGDFFSGILFLYLFPKAWEKNKAITGAAIIAFWMGFYETRIISTAFLLILPLIFMDTNNS